MRSLRNEFLLPYLCYVIMSLCCVVYYISAFPHMPHDVQLDIDFLLVAFGKVCLWGQIAEDFSRKEKHKNIDCPQVSYSLVTWFNRERIWKGRRHTSAGRSQLPKGEGTQCCPHPLWMNWRSHRKDVWQVFHFSGVTAWRGPILSVLEYCAITTYHIFFITSC